MSQIEQVLPNRAVRDNVGYSNPAETTEEPILEGLLTQIAVFYLAPNKAAVEHFGREQWPLTEGNLFPIYEVFCDNDENNWYRVSPSTADQQHWLPASHLAINSNH